MRGARKIAGLFAVVLPLAAAPCLIAVAAEGSGAGRAGSSEALFLGEIALLLIFGRLLSEAMLRIGQSAVMGQLITGVLLGPSVLGALWPDLQHTLFPPGGEQKVMIDAVAQLGVLMLLLLAGMETDLSVVGKLRWTALGVSMMGIAIPFACGVALGQLLPDGMLPHPEQRLITSLFLGTALSISSVKIVATVVREMNFLRRTVGQLIVTSAIIDDTVCWIVIAVTFGLALNSRVDLASLARTVLGTALFLVASFTVGRRLVFFVIRWANDNFVSEAAVITTILVVMCFMGLLTHAIGVHTVLGAFVAGILVGQSPILSRHIDEQLRGLITALFMPIFFGLAGLNADLRVLGTPQLLLLSLGFIAVASIGKFSGAFLGGTLSGLTWRESLALGWGMNARGSTEVIVASLGLSMQALSQALFSMIVVMTVVTTMAMPPMLRWAFARLPLRPDEKARIEREEFEARGFVANIERLLIAVDESESGRLASRLAGLLAGSRQIPSTVLQLSHDVPAGPRPALRSGSIVRETAGAAQIESAKADVARAGVDVMTRVGEAPTERAVAVEAKKGYSFLIVGVEPLEEKLADIATAFEGPMAIAVARGPRRSEPGSGSHLDILVPVTGTAQSHRGAEVALALARASLGSVSMLHVARGAPQGSRRSYPRWGAFSDNAEAILQEAVRLGDRFGVPVQTAARTQIAPESAILRHLEAGQHNLLVMGVSPRPGTALSFGETAAAAFERSERSILFVAS